MRTAPWLVVVSLALPLWACGSKSGETPSNMPQCSDGIDNDGDGLVDFPDDPGCISPTDDSEDSLPSPQCSDGRDNDGDGKIDYPDDPGCFSPNTDSETDDCPDGPMCPACSNGKDDDGNGAIDWPNDPGCSSAADPDEFSPNSNACGAGLVIKEVPFNGTDTDTLVSTSTSMISSPCGGGGGAAAIAYILNLHTPQVIVASTDDPNTQTDTVLDIRSMACTTAESEMGCNNDVNAAAGNLNSTLTQSLPAGIYYLIVEGKDASSFGGYTLTVKRFSGEGTTCTDTSMCGPGLVCRIPLGGSAMVCSKPMCSDGVDDDGDGKADYPDDPGCASPDDNDETDDCPNGPNCPECANGKDDDHDGHIDYPADPTCKAASGLSEACTSADPVLGLTMPVTAGDNTLSQNDYEPTCATETGGPDDLYRLDVPALDSLDITCDSLFSNDLVLLGATCGGTALTCTPDTISRTNVAAGVYYLVVDSDFTSDFGSYNLTVSGKIKAGASCESALAQSGALTCGSGFVCKGTVGARTCAKAACSDGIDNDHNGRVDYPNDPGCDSPEDDDESDPGCNLTTGVGCPVCSDKMDNDGDGQTDFPNDFGCSSAAGTSEVFCPLETDLPVTKITAATTNGTTVGKHDDFTASCGGLSGSPDVTHALVLPVPVVTLTIDTLGSAIDTVLTIKDPSCATEIACNDDGPVDVTSSITLTGVAAGNYAVTVDGFDSTTSGTYKLNVKGTVAAGTACSSPLFAAHVLACPTACTANVCH